MKKFLDKIIEHRIIWDPVMYMGGLWYYIQTGLKKLFNFVKLKI